jgi:microsomal epoxide hydrolase
VKGKGPNAVPLILTHGWPGSVLEFQEAIAPLTARGDISFDVVVPSLPGFGFSSHPAGKAVGARTTAVLWHKLMTGVLGYAKYGAQGGDWGNAVTLDLAAMYPDSLIGIHLNGTGTVVQVPESEQTEEERAWLKASTAFRAQEMDYFNIQMRKPQTVAFALSDNPVGWLAWMTEKLKLWSDSGDNIEKAFTKDQILTNAMIYLVNGAEATGVWFYRGQSEDGPNPIQGKIRVPTGFAAFPAEMPALNPPKHFLERAMNLVRYTKMPKGGHFAAMEQPELFAGEVRAFFSMLIR